MAPSPRFTRPITLGLLVSLIVAIPLGAWLAPGLPGAAVDLVLALLTLGALGWEGRRRPHPGPEASDLPAPEAPGPTQAPPLVHQLEDQVARDGARIRDLERGTIRFAEASGFAARALDESQGFLQAEVRALLTAFENLANLSLGVQQGVSHTFASLLDASTEGSLQGVVVESQTIAGSLKDFFQQLDRLHGEVRGYLTSNGKELARIREMAHSIEEFFESIRMISLNLSIEASRIGAGSGGKALQVLAQRLRDFSNRAQEISGEQKAVVATAGEVLTRSEADLNRHFSEVEARIPPLQRRLDTFPEIIAGAHGKFDEVLFSLTQLTAAVEGMLRDKLGQLQFPDLTRQEHEHLAQVLEVLSRPATGPHPSADTIREERLALARAYNDRATTANERRVLLAWMEQHGLGADEIAVKGSDREAGSVVLF